MHSFYEPVQILSQGEYHPPQVNPQAVGAFFSGGVDAFYTLLRNGSGRQPIAEYGITHAIFLFNLDLTGSQFKSYEKAAKRIRAFTEPIGIELITGNTNGHRFRSGIPKADPALSRGPSAGARMLATAMALSGGLGKIYIGSSCRFDYTHIEATNAVVDPYLSTEWFEVIHDGLVEERHDKIDFLVDKPETYDLLRVCRWEPNGVMNCGECPKCTRTMTHLAILGKLQRYTTFPDFKAWRILKWFSRHEEAHFGQFLLPVALKEHRWQLAGWLGLALFIAGLTKGIKRLVQLVIPDYRRAIPR